MQNESKKNEHTTTSSAIHDMSVAEVRKSLSFMRREWAKHSRVMPFFPSQTLPSGGIMVSDFAFRFVMGHHHKRHSRSQEEPCF